MELYDVSVHEVPASGRSRWVCAFAFPAPSPAAAVAAVAADFEEAGWSCLVRGASSAALFLPGAPVGSPFGVSVRAVRASSFPAFALPLRASVYPDPAFALASA